MTPTPQIEETTPALQPLSPALEKEVARIIEEAENDEEGEAASTLELGYSVPMPGVRYYNFL